MTPSTLALSTFPLVVIPTFVVLLDLWLHVVSLRYLLASRQRVATTESVGPRIRSTDSPDETAA